MQGYQLIKKTKERWENNNRLIVMGEDQPRLTAISIVGKRYH